MTENEARLIDFDGTKCNLRWLRNSRWPEPVKGEIAVKSFNRHLKNQGLMYDSKVQKKSAYINLRYIIMRIALLIIGLLISSCIYACGCSKPHNIKDSQLEFADYIFKGLVLKVETISEMDGTTQLVQFKIEELVKGKNISTITVEFNHGRSSCDLEKPSFNLGETYLISASEIHRVTETTANSSASEKKEISRATHYNNYCSLREKLS